MNLLQGRKFDLNNPRDEEIFTKYKPSFFKLFSQRYGQRYYGDIFINKRLLLEKPSIYSFIDESNQIRAFIYVNRVGKIGGIGIDTKLAHLCLGHKLIQLSIKHHSVIFAEIEINNRAMCRYVRNLGFKVMKNKLLLKNFLSCMALLITEISENDDKIVYEREINNYWNRLNTRCRRKFVLFYLENNSYRQHSAKRQ